MNSKPIKFENVKRASKFCYSLFTPGQLFSLLSDWFTKSENWEFSPLQPYKKCSSWLREVKHNNQTYVEVDRYEKGPELAEVVDRVRRKSGVFSLTVCTSLPAFYDDKWSFFFADYSLEKFDTGQVQKMYDACSYETGWDGDRMSPWCTLFTPQDLKALEFAEDLELWYRDGYGHHLTYTASCGMTKDIHNHIRYTI